MISQVSLEKILGLKEDVELDPTEMAKLLRVSFLSSSKAPSTEVQLFAKRLELSLKKQGVTIVPESDIWENVGITRLSKRAYNLVRLYIRTKLDNLSQKDLATKLTLVSIIKSLSYRRIKKGIAIVCSDENDLKRLPMQYISSFKTNSVITIIDFPADIRKDSEFIDHFNKSMSLFAYHMSNIIICADQTKWMLYNFNASHPIFEMSEISFDQNVLASLVPKIFAPITPHKLHEFKILPIGFDVNSIDYLDAVHEMQEGSALFSKTNLYPSGKKISDLKFRHPLHELIGRLHLDSRNGMSFGFLAFQLKTGLSELIELEKFRISHSNSFSDTDIFIDSKEYHYLRVSIQNKDFVLRVPDVWVLSLRSGSNKTNFDQNSDLIKIGLINGKLHMQFARGARINNEYKPSFDTKVILAHALGNAIIASILNHLNPNSSFVQRLENKGLAILHWHGYFNSSHSPRHLVEYGRNNPHVSCSSPQSALLAIKGKLHQFFDIIKSGSVEYLGDIHVEPHHGVNVTCLSIIDLAKYILNTPNSTQLGNKYL